MKKLISILLAVMMMGVCACAAMADERPEPEGGKKFGSDWAIGGGYVLIVYEEEGYRVSIDILKDDNTGSLWEYSCYYMEDTDSLKSVSSSRTNYTYDPDTNGKEFADPVYEGLDDENQVTEFTIDKDGFLIWKDGHEDAGAGLKFKNIGSFEGVWQNEAEAVRAEMRWNGATDDELFYTIYITRGKTDGDRYEEYTMNGFYNPATGKLEAMGTRIVFTKNANGEYDPEDDTESYDAVFSMTADGKVLYESGSGIVLDFNESWTN